MRSLEIRQVGPDNVEEVYEILKLCGEDMQERLGLAHWIPPSPLHLIRQSAQEKRVYVVSTGEQVIATFTIGNLAPSYYGQVNDNVWESPHASVLYMNRLAILPHFQGQGIGSWCLSRVESFALNENYEAIRFDAYAKHTGLLKFYQKAGYHQRGLFTVHTPRRGVAEIICFEKVRREFTGGTHEPD